MSWKLSVWAAGITLTALLILVIIAGIAMPLLIDETTKLGDLLRDWRVLLILVSFGAVIGVGWIILALGALLEVRRNRMKPDLP